MPVTRCENGHPLTCERCEKEKEQKRKELKQGVKAAVKNTAFVVIGFVILACVASVLIGW